MSLNTSKREIKDMSTPIPDVDLFGFDRNSGNNTGDPFGYSSNDVRCSSEPFGGGEKSGGDPFGG